MSSRAKPKSASRRRGPARIVPIVVGIAVVAAGLWWWTGRSSEGAESAYRTTLVERGDIRVAISATGTLSATSTVTVGSQISGQITDVLVDFNDKVVKGQIIARIDPSSYQAQIEQGSAQIASARASLAQAQATLENAELDYRRKADLGTQRLVAQSDIDLAKAALDQARAQVASMQAQIRQQTAATQTTRVNLDRTVIRSPVDGVVLLRSIEPGQTVAASMTAPELFQIAEDLAKMRIELSVDESDIGQVRTGQTVNFTADAFPDRQFRGVVEQVRLSATTTNNVVTYPVVVTVDNSDGTLLPGLTVNAEIEVSNRRNVLKVASAATRYKPADAAQIAMAAPSGAPAGGLVADLEAAAADLELNASQRAAFDAALAAMRTRQQERQQAGAQRAPAGGRGPAAGGPGGGPGGGARALDPRLQAQIRQRMTERVQQEFAGFTAQLDDTQRAQWQRTLASLVGATRTTLYRLVDGQREAVPVRIGASDGSSVEISGPVAEGDAIVIGERAPR
ncbi:efflux RND transporter periplasmic adaptor subunit [Luteimonas sp. gir]|uniref:efflux RND transporter periplasmic adaptor subunit n=1 Tax=Luteimonas sp. gir TaxID=3127960 RepID=UPI003075C187